ncbi:tol-pal system protein YbgF [candidate division KSB1 bacterium]|nr:tol-pal system protein YbgF [candidate division KSB1 bacterium]
MRKASLAILLAAVMVSGSIEVAAQSLAKRFMLGMSAGAQRLYSNGPTGKFGFGGEGHLGYRLTGRLGATLVGGYANLPYTIAGVSTKTNIFYGNLLLDFELLNKGKFHPYLLVGAGTYNYQQVNGFRKIEPSGIGGLGVRWLLGHKFALDINSTYHYGSSDRLDAILGSGNDRYASGRLGFSFFPGSSKAAPPKEELFSEQEMENTGMESAVVEVEPQPDSAAIKQQEEYTRLKAKVDELKQTLNSKESEIVTLSTALAESKERVVQIQNTVETQPPPASNNGDVRGLYEQALNKFYAKRYMEAMQTFADLANQFPNHPLVSNCHYWIGESHFQLRNYQEAVEALNRVLQFSQSPKKDDALLMLGKSYAQIKRTEEARQAFTRLIQEYPDSEYVSKASALLNRM